MSGAPATTTPTPTLEGGYTTLWDLQARTDGQPVYVGQSVPGSNTTAGKAKAQWRIYKNTYTTVGSVDILTAQEWANGVDTFSQVWDNRATTITYS